MMTTNPIERNNFGYHSLGAVVPPVAVGDPFSNVAYIEEMLKEDKLKNVEFLVFPELCITGYSAADLFFQDLLLDSAVKALKLLCDYLSNDNRLIAVGIPLRCESSLYNCAAIIQNGKVIGLVPKTYIPNYQEFYEKRWFSSGNHLKTKTIDLFGYDIPVGNDLLFKHNGIIFGVEICEDLWVPNPPSTSMTQNGALLILNLSATDEVYGKHKYLQELLKSQSSRCRCGYIYSSAGKGESSTDLVFSGNAIIYDNGLELAHSKRFSISDCFVTAYIDFEKLENDRRKYSSFAEFSSHKESYRLVETNMPSNTNVLDIDDFKNELTVDPHPFVPSDASAMQDKCDEIINIQSWGLQQRLQATRCKTIVVGISGGLDSTLALLIATRAFKNLGLDTKGIYGITMPGKATTSRTYNNAIQMMRYLGVTIKEIPINEAVDLHFKDIGHDSEIKDAVYENSQARERTQILMDMANKVGGMVLGTGDLSELALGWCTYNGDQMSMYNVNAGVPKTLVKYLVNWFVEKNKTKELGSILTDIINTPISPELVPAENEEEIKQKTEELVGPYELHDFFLFNLLRHGFSPAKIFKLATIAFKNKYDNEVILKWLEIFYHRFFSQQFKRSAMPDGPKVGSVSLSPRGDWRMPSDVTSRLYLQEIEKIKQEEDLRNAIITLKKGGIILYPTDTVWGIGCDATNKQAVKRVFDLKKRTDAKSLISLVDSVDSLKKWVDKVDGKLEEIILNSERPTTFIYDNPKGLAHNMISEEGSAALRITHEPFSHKLCKAFGKPIVSTSANISGESTPSCFKEIADNVKQKVDYVVKTGRNNSSAKPSRIIKIVEDKIVIIRE